MRNRSLLLLFPLVVLAAGCKGQDPDELSAPPPKEGAVVEKAEGKKLIGGEGAQRAAVPPPTDAGRAEVIN